MICSLEPYSTYKRVDIDSTAHLTISNGVVVLRLFGLPISSGISSVYIPSEYRPRESMQNPIVVNVTTIGLPQFLLGWITVSYNDGELGVYVIHDNSAIRVNGNVYGEVTWIL